MYIYQNSDRLTSKENVQEALLFQQGFFFVPNEINAVKYRQIGQGRFEMLYIIRHGKTDWNARRRLQGRTDVPLNSEGRRMAENARLEYADVHFDVCYCSPLIRARETAEILLRGRDVPIITDERLVEMSFGVCEGTEVDSQKPGSPINILFTEPGKYVTPVAGGESFEQLFARTGEFLREVVGPQLQQGKDILIVGHGAMNSSIVCQVRGLPLDKFWSAGIENCKLMKLI